jgi:group II intron reverse transcriptase/maturase
MRTAEDILNIIRDRGKRGLPLEDVYRQLFKPSLYLRAYSRIYRNDGAMTRGTTPETVDGMSLAKINEIIEALRFERYRWTPVRRTHLPKPKSPGKTRPLGIPTWSDKLLQEVMRSLLEAYYEPQFADSSHGFRPERGCHTALTTVATVWRGTRWFIEGDIKGCFDNIDHGVLLTILREQIHDNRFLRLVESLLQAGYLEEWRYHPTMSGTPQGGISSPILANIYLDRLDQYVEQTLLPEYTRGKFRKPNPEYRKLGKQAQKHRAAARRGSTRERGDWHYEKARELKQQSQTLPSGDPQDPGYRRLRYVRYADDFLLGFTGPKAEAEAIKAQLATFLRDELKLELSAEKTLITHATTEKARFLGYNIHTRRADDKHDPRGRRSLNASIGLRIPAEVIHERGQLYTREGKPIHRAELEKDDDYSIVLRYQAEYQGYVQYYLLAENVTWLNRLHWIMRGSLLKTLADKHQTSVQRVVAKYHATRETEHGPRACLKVIRDRPGKKPLTAHFGGLPLVRKKTAILEDRPTGRFGPQRTEIIQRLLADTCEVCGSHQDTQVHHVRKLADLRQKGRKEKPYWVQMMAARKRKTLVLCQPCHTALHVGKLQKPHEPE